MKLQVLKLKNAVITTLVATLAVGGLIALPALAAESSIPVTVELIDVSTGAITKATDLSIGSGKLSDTTDALSARVQAKNRTARFKEAVYRKASTTAALPLTALNGTLNGDTYEVEVNRPRDTNEQKVKLTFSGTAQEVRPQLIFRYYISAANTIDAKFNVNGTNRASVKITGANVYKNTAGTFVSVPKNGSTVFTVTAPRQGAVSIPSPQNLRIEEILDKSTERTLIKQYSITDLGASGAPTIDVQAQGTYTVDGDNRKLTWQLLDGFGASERVKIDNNADTGHAYEYQTNQKPVSKVGLFTYDGNASTLSADFNYNTQLQAFLDIIPPVYDDDRRNVNFAYDGIEGAPFFDYIQFIRVNGQNVLLPQPVVPAWTPSDTENFTAREYVQWYNNARKQVFAALGANGTENDQTYKVDGTGANAGSEIHVRLYDARTVVDKTTFKGRQDGYYPNANSLAQVTESNIDLKGPKGWINENKWQQIIMGNQWRFRYYIWIQKVRPNTVIANKPAMQIEVSAHHANRYMLGDVAASGVKSSPGVQYANGTIVPYPNGKENAIGLRAKPENSSNINAGTGNTGDNFWRIMSPDGWPWGRILVPGERPESVTPAADIFYDRAQSNQPYVDMRFQVQNGFTNPVVKSERRKGQAGTYFQNPNATANGRLEPINLQKGNTTIYAKIPLYEINRKAVLVDQMYIGRTHAIEVNATPLDIEALREYPSGAATSTERIGDGSFNVYNESVVTLPEPKADKEGYAFVGYKLKSMNGQTVVNPDVAPNNRWQPGAEIDINTLGITYTNNVGNVVVDKLVFEEIWEQTTDYPRVYYARRIFSGYQSNGTPITGIAQEEYASFHAVQGLTASIVGTPDNQVTNGGTTYTYDSARSITSRELSRSLPPTLLRLSYASAQQITTLSLPANKVNVTNPLNLTDAEKAAVREAVLNANSNLKTLVENSNGAFDVVVEDDGSVRVVQPNPPAAPPTLSWEDTIKMVPTGTLAVTEVEPSSMGMWQDAFNDGLLSDQTLATSLKPAVTGDQAKAIPVDVRKIIANVARAYDLSGKDGKKPLVKVNHYGYAFIVNPETYNPRTGKGVYVTISPAREVISTSLKHPVLTEIPLANINSLTDDQKKTVAVNVLKAQYGSLLNDSTPTCTQGNPLQCNISSTPRGSYNVWVSVDDDGSAQVIWHNGEGDAKVTSDKLSKTFTVKPAGYKPATSLVPYGGDTPNTDQKDAIKQAFIAANNDILPEGSTVTVNDNTITVNYPDGTSNSDIPLSDYAIKIPSPIKIKPGSDTSSTAGQVGSALNDYQSALRTANGPTANNWTLQNDSTDKVIKVKTQDGDVIASIPYKDATFNLPYLTEVPYATGSSGTGYVESSGWKLRVDNTLISELEGAVNAANTGRSLTIPRDGSGAEFGLTADLLSVTTESGAKVTLSPAETTYPELQRSLSFVQDASALSTAEQAAVKTAFLTKNPALAEVVDRDTAVSISADAVATVTLGDGRRVTVSGLALTKQALIPVKNESTYTSNTALRSDLKGMVEDSYGVTGLSWNENTLTKDTFHRTLDELLVTYPHLVKASSTTLSDTEKKAIAENIVAQNYQSTGGPASPVPTVETGCSAPSRWQEPHAVASKNPSWYCVTVNRNEVITVGVDNAGNAWVHFADNPAAGRHQNNFAEFSSEMTTIKPLTAITKRLVVHDRSNLTTDEEAAVLALAAEQNMLATGANFRLASNNDTEIVADYTGVFGGVNHPSDTSTDISSNPRLEAPTVSGPDLTIVGSGQLNPSEITKIKAAIKNIGTGGGLPEEVSDGDITVDPATGDVTVSKGGVTIEFPHEMVIVRRPELLPVEDMKNIPASNSGEDNGWDDAVRKAEGQLPARYVCAAEPSGSPTSVRCGYDSSTGANPVTFTAADLFKPSVIKPTLTPVVNKSALTEDEKSQVESKIRDIAGEGYFPANADAFRPVDVSDNGETKITFADESTTKLTQAQTVIQIPVRTPVRSWGNLVNPPSGGSEADKAAKAVAEAERAAIIAAIKAANGHLNLEADGIDFTFANDGDAGERVEIKKGATLLATLSKEQVSVEAPALTPVGNLQAVTADERQNIAKKLIGEQASGNCHDADATCTFMVDGKKVEIKKDGSAIVYKTSDDSSEVEFARYPANYTVRPDQLTLPENAWNTVSGELNTSDNQDKPAESKADAIAKLKELNPYLNNDGVIVAVDENGGISVTYPDSAEPVTGQTFPLAKLPNPTPIRSMADGPTDAELEAIKQAIAQANNLLENEGAPATSRIEFQEGNFTFTKDGVPVEMTLSDVAVQAPALTGVKEMGNPSESELEGNSERAQIEAAITQAVGATNIPTTGGFSWQANGADDTRTGTVVVSLKDGRTVTFEPRHTQYQTDFADPVLTPVANPSAVSSDEIAEIKRRFWQANPGFAENAGQTVNRYGGSTGVGPDGAIAMTWADGEERTALDGDHIVTLMPQRTGVQVINDLSDGEKEKVATRIMEALAKAQLAGLVSQLQGNTDTPPTITCTIARNSGGVAGGGAAISFARGPVFAANSEVEGSTCGCTLQVGEDGTAVNFNVTVADDGKSEVISNGFTDPTSVRAFHAVYKPEHTVFPLPQKITAPASGLTNESLRQIAENINGSLGATPGTGDYFDVPANPGPGTNSGYRLPITKDGKPGVIKVYPDGRAEIEFPDGSKGEIAPIDTWRPSIEALNPREIVGNTSNLTDQEKAKLIDRFVKEIKWPGKPSDPDEAKAKIQVGPDGTVTVTLPNGEKLIWSPDKTVQARPTSGGTGGGAGGGLAGGGGSGTPEGTPTTPAQPTNPATPDQPGVNPPGNLTPVQDPHNLTPAEREQVAREIREANPNMPADARIIVGPDGTTEIVFGDGTRHVLSPEMTVLPIIGQPAGEGAGRAILAKTGLYALPIGGSLAALLAGFGLVMLARRRREQIALAPRHERRPRH